MVRVSKTRDSRPPWVKWYKTSAWKRLRKSQLNREPLCRFCKRKGIITQGNTVDHISPHRGKMEKFFDITNLQTLCKSCHSSTKQRIEKSGEFGCDKNGIVPNWK